MANLIIPREHQAAPRVKVDLSKGKILGNWAKSYDAEMDDIARPLDKDVELRRMDKSPDQSIEMAQEEYETNYGAHERDRLEGQERWQGKDREAMRKGRILHPYRFIKMLAAAGVDARIEAPPMETVWLEKPEESGVEQFDISVSNCRLWLNAWSRRGLIGINAWVRNPATGRREHQTITTIQYPWAIEYSIVAFDKYSVPKGERFKGWRSTLLSLVVQNVISEAEAHRAFGEPMLNEASELYRMQLQGHRRMQLGLVQ